MEWGDQTRAGQSGGGSCISEARDQDDSVNNFGPDRVLHTVHT